MANTLPTIPAAILAQLGGSRFCAMVGATKANALVYSADSLTIAFGSGAKNKANRARVALDGSDTYTVEFFSVRGINCTSKGRIEGVYADNLPQVFAGATGFRTSL